MNNEPLPAMATGLPFSACGSFQHKGTSQGSRGESPEKLTRHCPRLPPSRLRENPPGFVTNRASRNRTSPPLQKQFQGSEVLTPLASNAIKVWKKPYLSQLRMARSSRCPRPAASRHWKHRCLGCQTPAGVVYTHKHPHTKMLLPGPILL